MPRYDYDSSALFARPQKRRRKRYVVEVNGETKHCLAYDRAWVVENCPGATSIRLWSDAKRDQARHAGTWVVDPRALSEAIEFFSLSLAVDVELLDGAATTAGSHSLVPVGEAFVRSDGRIVGLNTATAGGTEWRHKIKLRRGQSPAQASRTLWHELTHAMQAERRVGRMIDAGVSPRKVFDAWKFCHERGHRTTAYEHKPVEIEARTHEDYADALPLVKECG